MFGKVEFENFGNVKVGEIFKSLAPGTQDKSFYEFVKTGKEVGTCFSDEEEYNFTEKQKVLIFA